MFRVFIENEDYNKRTYKYAGSKQRRCAENVDYPMFSKNLENGGRTIEHIISVDMTEYGFTENVDYNTCFPNLESGCNGGQNMIDYEISVDFTSVKKFHA